MFNLERSPFRKGEWTGYSYGVWRVYKGTSGYRAYKLIQGSQQADPAFRPLEARTLREMSKALADDQQHITP